MSEFTSHPIKDLADIVRFENERPFAERYDARSVYDVFLKSAQQRPYRPALTMIMTGESEETPRVVCYKKLLQGITRAANLFATIGGDAPGVAYLLPALPETHFTHWGAQTAGYAVPVNYLLRAENIAELLEAAGVSILVTLGPHPAFDIWEKAVAVKRLLPDLILLQVGLPGGTPAKEVVDFTDALAQQDSDRLIFGGARSGDDIAAYFHTGGTTGLPKLVAQTHMNQIVASFGGTVIQGLSERDTLTGTFPLFHVAATISSGLSYFIAGGHVIIMSPTGMRNPQMLKNFWQIIERERVTVIAAVPTALAALLDYPVDADISSVRRASTGATQTPRAVAEKFEAMVGVRLHEILGMTETAGLISYDPAAGQRVRGSAGFRLPYTSVLIRKRDSDGGLGQPCGPHEVGVLTVAGPHVTPGYRNEEHNTHLRDDGYLDSGDLAYQDEAGRLFIVGRAKDLIIRSGHNIDPVLIESALQKHPAVALAAAVGQPDRYAGELPVCYVALRPGMQASSEELREFATPLIAERPAWPKQILIIDAIPVTSVGKIYKPQLREDAVRRLVFEMVMRELGTPDFGLDVSSGGKAGCSVTVTLGEDHSHRCADVARLLDGYLFRYRVLVPSWAAHEAVGDPG